MDEEEWVIYLVTLFTFAVIFFFCYIRHVFTFFERNQMPTPTYPSFPFGNIYDVLIGKIPFFMQLWKFYNRFKRKKCNFGGFYIFLKPAVVILDSRLSEIVISRSDYFQDLDDTNASNFNSELSKKLLLKITRSIHSVLFKLESCFEGDEVNFGEIIYKDFVEKCAQEFFDLKNYDMFSGTSSIFRRLFSFGYPQFRGAVNKPNKINMIKDIIQNRRKNNVKLDDVIQILLENNFSDKEIIDFVFDMLHNLKITNNLIMFALYELCHNKEIQDDLRGEITRFKKNRSIIDYNELNELSYLETITNETLRKYPRKPFIGKVCKEDYTDDEVKLPKGILVFISTFGVHHDAQNYINPELFDPDRFSEENEKYVNQKQYLPFGERNKNDFGSLFVKLVMKLILIEVLSKCKLLPGNKSPKSIQFDEKSFDSLKLKEDLWLKVVKV